MKEIKWKKKKEMEAEAEKEERDPRKAWATTRKKINHELREAWREREWEKFQQQDRRDSRELERAKLDTKRIGKQEKL